MTGLLKRVPVDRVIVAIDPGKVLNRVWITTEEGLVGEPMSLPTSRAGLERLGAPAPRSPQTPRTHTAATAPAIAAALTAQRKLAVAHERAVRW